MARLFMCLAVLAVVAASVAANGDVSVTADASKDAAAKDVQFTKQMPTITMPTIEMPTVTKEDAPCEKKCSNVCTVSLKKSCKKVPVTNKECATVTKTTTTKKCHKKCCVDIPVPAPASDAPSAANPSAPAAEAAAPAQAAASIMLPSLHGKGRRLSAAQGLPLVDALLGKMQKPAATCGEVMCEDVPSTSSEVQCKDLTKEVEQCSTVPAKDCQEVCKCIPMQKVTLTLPSHPFKG